MKWMVHVACMEEMRHAYINLVGKPKAKRPYGYSEHKWKDSVKINLKEIGSEVVDWIHLPVSKVL
jgi:hypothetical protein